MGSALSYASNSNRNAASSSNPQIIHRTEYKFDELLKELASYLAKTVTSHHLVALQDKLTLLSNPQLHEITNDFYDEVVRRKSKVEGKPVLIPVNGNRDEFHPNRSQARQKLSNLSASKFEDLCGAVYFELSRRYPGIKEGDIGWDKSTIIPSDDDNIQETCASASTIANGGDGNTSWSIREVFDTHGDIEAHLLSLCATSGIWYIIPRETHTLGFIIDFTDPSFRNVVAQPWNYLDWATPSRINILLELLYSEQQARLPGPDQLDFELFRCMRRISSKVELLPSSLYLRNLVKEGEHPICGGGYADIWKGRTADGHSACLKVLRIYAVPQSSRNKVFTEFSKEVLVWSQLDHPNVHAFLGVNIDLFPGNYCLVSPWCDHGSVTNYLNRHPEADKMKIIQDILCGLEYLHSRRPPVVHGDLKGANILVTDSGECRLADFGLAGTTSTLQTLSSSTGSTHGSVRWMAPELLDYKVISRPTTSTDVYSFGCTIFEIVTQTPPFSELKSDVVVSLAVLGGDRPLRPIEGFTDVLWIAVQRCWEHSGNDRPSILSLATTFAELQTPKLVTYPFDCDDLSLLESDRSTYMLLQYLNRNGTPSFINYGTHHPSSVLDLGCGEGYWMLDAATYWKQHDTQITGFDHINLTERIHPLVMKSGVANNIKFVQGNFLTQGLPFKDESFDLIRMANLTYAIPYDKWRFVLEEVCRVLTIGGRLEFIDDHIFFPESATAKLSGDTASLNTSTVTPEQQLTEASRYPLLHDRLQFQTQMDISRELETLFERMMNLKFGVHLCPSEFVLEMMSDIFGHSRKIEDIDLIIAPPNSNPVAATFSESVDSNDGDLHSASTVVESFSDHDDYLKLSAGLMVWSSGTLIPMSFSELQTHAFKHSQTLLLSKSALTQFAVESSKGLDDETMKELLCEYKSFLSLRLMSSPTQMVSSRPSSEPPGEEQIRDTLHQYLSTPSNFPASSESFIQESTRSTTNPIAETLNERLREINKKVGRITSYSIRKPNLLEQDHKRTITSLPALKDIKAVPSSYLHSIPTPVMDSGSLPLNRSRIAGLSTHVRKFHIYEAIKMCYGKKSAYTSD